MEEKDDYKERASNFIKEYGELVKKYDVDFSSYPQFVPATNQQGAFLLVVTPTTVDMKKQATESPFVEKA